MRTFFLNPQEWRAPYRLSGQEAQHLSRVLRLRPGEEIHLLDGAGREGIFRIASVDKKGVLLDEISLTEHPRPQGGCTLAVAYTKAARRSWLLEKAVELAAASIWFWQAEHSQAKLPDLAKENWRAELIAGAKQCGNPWLPELAALPDGAAALAARSKTFDHCFLFWEDAGQKDLLTPENVPSSGRSLLILGPEGGLSAKEVALLTACGCKPVSLGPRVLRWETAALLALGLFWWKELLPKA